jgi:ParB family chromosome partitioning protein
MVAARSKDPDTVRLERELSDRIGAPVSITFDGKSAGTLVIKYTSVDELEGILKHLR